MLAKVYDVRGQQTNLATNFRRWNVLGLIRRRNQEDNPWPTRPISPRMNGRFS
jgi:predicted DNA-binding ribbon-helix-helix protein